ncbi:MAG TPA: TIR domain-containing protein [Streptosporangiaceae bacterium]|nr:TIR domain-containing protein [Streptosporangiaceae bacterium]
MTRYDVALSFADEDREYVEAVAESLQARAVKVFYDRHEEAELWGKNLIDYFDHVYQRAATFCVIFISEAYARKDWTDLERKYSLEAAFGQSREYILPARFDDTNIPGIPKKSVRYQDLRTTSPARLADLICQKIQSQRFEADPRGHSPGIRWFAGSEVSLGAGVASVRVFQHLPIWSETAPLTSVTSELLHRLISSAKTDRSHTYWTTGKDRRFDRIYATSSVLTALCHLGGTRESALIERSIAYLKHSEPSSLDDRAATIFLLLIGELPSEALSGFLHTLAERQQANNDLSTKGSFLLTQGPEADEHWTDSHHAGAWSFHACHIADALLHIPSQLAECQHQAEPILNGIRDFLIRSFTAYDGWLLDGAGKKTPLTLFSYALCPGLDAPLPINWRDVGAECLRMSSQLTGRVLTRFFGVMNAAYAAHSTRDEDFTNTAVEFARAQLASLPSVSELDRLEAVDLAGLLRSIAYGVDLADRRFAPSISAATAAALAT